MKTSLRLLAPAAVAVALLMPTLGTAAPLDLNAEHRAPEHSVRDEHRNPQQTLDFFGITPDMTVVEIWPGSGYYAELLAPYLRENGRYIAAAGSVNGSAYGRRSLGKFLLKMGEQPEVFGKATVTALSYPTEMRIAEPGSADAVLTFRNVHNWMYSKSEQAVFAAMFVALKPGGTLGVVEHRWPEDMPGNADARNGYVRESYVRELAEAVGFEFVGSSDINANPRDDHEHPNGVWTLPPRLRTGDEDPAPYAAIGESDRFTLKFVKPAE